MLTRDYIMRMIETLSIALQKIFLMKDAKNFKGAIEELDRTSQKFIGLQLKFIDTFSEEKIIELLKLEKDTAPAKLYITGILLKEEAAVKFLEKDEFEGEELYIKSLSLFLEAYLTDYKPVFTDHHNLIGEVLNIFNIHTLPENILQKIFKYYEATSQFSKAENIIFILIETNPKYINDGIVFYKRLLKKSNDELAAGNLPRNEVEEALSELRNKSNN